LGASSWLSRWGVGLDLGVQAPHWVWRLLKSKILKKKKSTYSRPKKSQCFNPNPGARNTSILAQEDLAFFIQVFN